MKSLFEEMGVTYRQEGDYLIPNLSLPEEPEYQVGKITFIVTPVYKDEGEPMRDILLKLMLADLEPA